MKSSFAAGDKIKVNITCPHTTEKFGPINESKHTYLGNVFEVDEIRSTTNCGDMGINFAVIQGWYFCLEDLSLVPK